MKRMDLEQSNEEFYTSHSGLALAGACINRYSDLGRHIGRVGQGSGHISEPDIFRSYLGLLCLGKTDYQAIDAMRDDLFFLEALGIKRIPSAERLRQRLDAAGAKMIPAIVKCSHAMLKQLNHLTTTSLYPLVPTPIFSACSIQVRHSDSGVELVKWSRWSTKSGLTMLRKS